MGLEVKLDRMCARADRDARIRLQRHMRNLALLVATALKTGKWADLPVKTQLKIEDTANAAIDAAELADAADFVSNKVLTADNGRVIDIRSNSDFHAIQERILGLFESKEAPPRGFVYVAWSARPEEFLYVGRAKDSGRLGLTAHGKLAHATASASTVSLLFPTQSRANTIESLEACVIRLVEEATGSLPKLNSRRETLPLGDSLRELERLAAFLNSVAKRITPLSD